MTDRQGLRPRHREALFTKHWDFIELLVRENGKQSMGVLVEALRQRGVPYRDAPAYVWSEVDQGRLYAEKVGKTWTFVLIDEHPALAGVRVFGRRHD